MPQQQYIKYLYEQEGLSVNQIGDRVSVDWRTAAKYAKKYNWNPSETAKKRHKPILEPGALCIVTIDVYGALRRPPAAP